MAERYKRARKKGKILDSFIEATGYNRCYAGWLLRNWGCKVVIYDKGERIVLVGDKEEEAEREKEEECIL